MEDAVTTPRAFRRALTFAALLSLACASAPAWAGSGNSSGGSAPADPVNAAIAACVSLPTDSTSGASSSGSVTGPSGCEISSCVSTAAVNVTTWLPWYCDRGSVAPYPSEAWSSCVRWFFTGRWEGLAAQATGLLGGNSGQGGTTPSSSRSARECRAYQTAAATAYAEIHDEWACLSGSLRSASSGQANLESMHRDVEFIMNALGAGTNNGCTGGAGASSSSSGGSVPPSTFTFGSSSSGSVSGSANGRNQANVSTIGFDTGSPSLNAALATGVQGPIPGCRFDGSNQPGQTCDKRAYQQFQGYCDTNCVFPHVSVGSQAAHDLGLGNPPQPGARGSVGRPITISGQPYVYCANLGYWNEGTSCNNGSGGGTN